MSVTWHLVAAMLQAMSSSCPMETDSRLFECDEQLGIEIEVPLKTLKREASRRPELDATLRWVDSRGALREFDVQLTTRGHSRLETCSFPPLSLLLEKKTMKGTVFAEQKKLKIVLPCKQGSRYRDFLLQEYGIYKAYEIVATPAFRVRLLSITFRDADKPDKTEQKVAFFIESIKEVAARGDMDRIKENSVPPDRLERGNASTYELFQFMIANTDWSKLKGPGDEDCCHNGKVLAPKKADSGWFVVPYDFDQAGLINTPYARPDERLNLRSVRQRLFRGRCEYLPVMDDTIAKFNRHREDLEAALAAGVPSNRALRSQTGFVDKFFDIINDPDDRAKHIDGRCLGRK